MKDEKLEKLGTDQLIATVKEIIYSSIGYEKVVEHVPSLDEAKKLYKNLKYFKFANENDVKEMPEIIKEVIEHVNQSIIYHKDKVSQIVKPVVLSKKELRLAVENILEIAVEKATTDDELEECAELIEIFINEIKWADDIRENIYGEKWLKNRETVKELKPLITRN